MTIAEGGGRRAVSHKLRDMYIPTLKANYMVWPLVQIINFRIMPIQFQLVSLPLRFIRSHLLMRHSLSSQQLVLRGLHIFPLPMLRKMLCSFRALHRRPTFAWLKPRYLQKTKKQDTNNTLGRRYENEGRDNSYYRAQNLENAVIG
jgi:hypothetical protein